ncbi:MAG: hypothetical protein JW730_10150, partial [Anaerolineales bacterium]|nr:hypothetical protein [Anaerolineales bacterium]
RRLQLYPKSPTFLDYLWRRYCFSNPNAGKALKITSPLRIEEDLLYYLSTEFFDPSPAAAGILRGWEGVKSHYGMVA